MGATAGDSFPVDKVEACANTAKMDFATLKTCFSGDEGAALEQTYFDMTPADHTCKWLGALRARTCRGGG